MFKMGELTLAFWGYLKQNKGSGVVLPSNEGKESDERMERASNLICVA